MLSQLASYVLIASSVLCHPVPDGLVFRGVQVVVRSDRIEIRYQVGLSDAMIRRELGADTSEMGGAEALARYRDRMFPRLPERMDVSIDDRPAVLLPQRADIVRQPHAQLEFVYEVVFRSDGEPKRFQLVDGNYPGVPGYHRAAIRGRGTVQVVPAGSQELFARLPEIPEATDGETTTFPSVRKIEAFLRSSEPAADSQDAETLAAERDSAQVGSMESGTASLPNSGPEDRALASPPAAEFPTSPKQPHVRGGGADLDRFIWLAGFGGLAVLIALAWLRSWRQQRRI